MSTCPEKLAAFGITAEPEEDGLIRTTVDVVDVDHLRSLLDVGFAPEQRQTHYDGLWVGIASQGTLLDRVYRFLVGNGELSPEDRAAVASTFPLAVAVTTAPGPITVNTPIDLSSPTGNHVVCFTDVTMVQGGSFTCSATNLTFICDTLTRTGTTGSTAADFNILGKLGAPQPTPDPPAPPPQAGKGTDAECASPGVKGQAGGTGQPGTLSNNGIDAPPVANPSLASQPATIVIKTALKLAAPITKLTFFGQSGVGGNGGNGGKGGPGQQGGVGGRGSGCCGECSGGGVGGSGGKGGTGGSAGNGGNGVDAAGNVTIATPSQADWQKLSYTAIPAPWGNPGKPGPGGDPGGKGPGGPGGQGSAGTSCGDGPEGAIGLTGDQGKWGVAGTLTGKPPQFQFQLA